LSHSEETLDANGPLMFFLIKTLVKFEGGGGHSFSIYNFFIILEGPTLYPSQVIKILATDSIDYSKGEVWN
jgi:hypothetical protein